MLKDILVHVDASERCRVRVEIAAGLARRHGARLTGVFGQIESDAPSLVARRASGRLHDSEEKAKAVFMDVVTTTGITHRWLPLPFGEYNYVVREMVICARYADLVILGQHDPDGEIPLPPELPEEVMLNCGRPVLLIPYAGLFPVFGEHPVVAWNGEREAVRALNDSLPLLVDAKKVTVLVLHGRLQADPERVPHVDIADHLSCHGITVHPDNLVVSDSGGIDLILSRAADLGADLLVIGAHGNYGFPYIHRGGGTRQILREMPVPVLMSH